MGAAGGQVTTETTKSENKHMKIQKYVGLDVHKDKTTVAIAEGDRNGEVRSYGEISSDLVTTERALRKIRGEQGELHVAYEAGPTGFVLHRHLTRLGIDCIVSRRRARRSPRAAARKPTGATPSSSPGCIAPAN